MVLTSATSPPTSTQDYTAQFYSYIANCLDALMVALHTNPAQSDITQLRAPTVLDFAFKVPALWRASYDLTIALSPHMERTGRWAEWVQLLNHALAQAQNQDDDRAAAELSLSLGVFHRMLANYDQARLAFDRAAAHYAVAQDAYNLARILSRHAQMERTVGQLDAAHTLAAKALALLNAPTLEPHANVEFERARCYTALGTVAYDRFEAAQAETYYRLALEAYRRQPNNVELAEAYADLGTALRGQKKYTEAITAYQYTLSLLADLDAPARKAVYQLNLSAIYLSMDKPRPALELCLQSEATFRQIKDLRRLVMVQTNIGMAYAALAGWHEAEQWLLSASDRAHAFPQTPLLANALDELAMVYLHTGRHAAAIITFQAALAQADRIEDPKAKAYYAAAIREHLEQAQVHGKLAAK